MLSTSFAIIALASASFIPPFGNLVHMHPRTAPPDTRIQLTLVNTSPSFRDVKIDGRNYEIPTSHTLYVKAPAGTVIFANSLSPLHRRGDVLVSLTPELNHQTIDLK